MPSLSTLQQQLQAYLLHGKDAVAAHLLGTTRVPVATRLAIYRNAYRARLTAALEANYPALAKLLGPEAFAALAGAYIDAHESRFFSIRSYGDALAQFLTGAADYADAPLLAELARWEWAIGEAFDAGDAQPIGAVELAAIPPDRWAGLCFTWHPSVRVLALLWNAPQTWKAMTQDTPRPVATLCEAPQPWLVWRFGLEVLFRPLDAAESRLLALARYGSSFGQLCDALCADLEEEAAAAQAAAWLRGWVQAGLIVGVDGGH